MTKAQAAALLLAGATAGIGARELAEHIGPSVAVAKPSAPFTHAVDLRRRPGSTLAVSAYATQLGADGGVAVDLGQAKSCKPKKTTDTACTRCMDGLADDCVW